MYILYDRSQLHLEQLRMETGVLLYVSNTIRLTLIITIAWFTQATASMQSQKRTKNTRYNQKLR